MAGGQGRRMGSVKTRVGGCGRRGSCSLRQETRHLRDVQGGRPPLGELFCPGVAAQGREADELKAPGLQYRQDCGEQGEVHQEQSGLAERQRMLQQLGVSRQEFGAESCELLQFCREGGLGGGFCDCDPDGLQGSSPPTG